MLEELFAAIRDWLQKLEQGLISYELARLQLERMFLSYRNAVDSLSLEDPAQTESQIHLLKNTKEEWKKEIPNQSS